MKEDFLRDFFNMSKGKSAAVGKKLVKYERAWIIIGQVKENLYLAVHGGTSPPCQVFLVRAEDKELIDA